MEIKGPTKYGGDQIVDVIVPDRKENYMDQVPENTSPSKEKVVPTDSDIDARDKTTTSMRLETIDARDEGVQEDISGLVHKTPKRRTSGPQNRNRKIRDEANYWNHINVSDIEEKSVALISAGQPARGRRSTKRP
jgi:hypothetical protein